MTNFSGISSSAQSSKKFSDAQRTSSAASAIEKRMSAGRLTASILENSTRFGCRFDFGRSDLRIRARPRDSLQPGAKGSDINELRHPRFQTARAINQKQNETGIESKKPDVEVSGVQLMVGHQTQSHQI